MQGLTSSLDDTMAIQEPTLQALWNTLFWVALGLAAVVVLHAAVRGVIIWRRRRMPVFLEVRATHACELSACQPCSGPPAASRPHCPSCPLQWPRVELMFCGFVLPVLAAQGASECPAGPLSCCA